MFLVSLKWTDLLLSTIKWQIRWVRWWHFYIVTFQNRAALQNVMLKVKLVPIGNIFHSRRWSHKYNAKGMRRANKCHWDGGLREFKAFNLNSFLLPTVSCPGRTASHRVEQGIIQSCLVQGTWAWVPQTSAKTAGQAGGHCLLFSCSLSVELRWVPRRHTSGLVSGFGLPRSVFIAFIILSSLNKNPFLFWCEITSILCCSLAATLPPAFIRAGLYHPEKL